MRAGTQLIPLMPMPGWLTEGPMHAMQSASDWRFRSDGVYNTGSNNPPGVFNGPAPAQQPWPYQQPNKPWFDTYAWRPSGDGTQPMYPTEADLAKIYGYWPIFDNKPSRPSGFGAPDDPGDHAGLRLALQVTSTLAIVAIAGLGIAAYVKDRKRGR